MKYMITKIKIMGTIKPKGDPGEAAPGAAAGVAAWARKPLK